MSFDIQLFKDSIKSPFTEIDNIKELVNIYSHTMDYSFLRRINTCVESNTYDNIRERNSKDFYLFVFNNWKNNISCISQEKVKALIDNGIVGKDFYKLQDYLKYIPDVSSKDEIEKYLNPKDREIRILTRRYGYDKEKKEGWNFIYSEFISGLNNFHYPTEMFLTINSKSYDTLKLCRLFQKSCISKDLPYYYKFDVSGHIRDNIVIYSDFEHVNEYLEILSMIKEKFPNIISRCGKTSLCTGNVNSYIGCGEQDDLSDNDYYDERCRHLSECITNNMMASIKKNYNKPASNDIKDIKMIDYIAGIISLNFMNNADLRYITNKEHFKSELFSIIRKRLKSFFSSNSTEIPDITFAYSNKRVKSNYKIPSSFIMKVLRENAVTIYDCIPNSYNSLERYIYNSSYMYGFSNNYCFNNNDTCKTNFYSKK